jgi:cytochrome c nitrite reductase small subunit
MKLKEVYYFFVPPPKWRVTVIITVATLAGIALVIFHISNASSYLSDNPRACINCHVMTTEYASWQRSSHARVATCNDCHVPHDNFIRKYAFKASDGMRHAAMFTFRLEPQVIQIKEAGQNVVQENCLRCHADQMHTTYLSRSINKEDTDAGLGRFCWDCHRETPHGRIKSLSAYPDARVPQLNPVIPGWLDNFTK